MDSMTALPSNRSQGPSPRKYISCDPAASFLVQSEVLAGDQGNGKLSTRHLQTLFQAVPLLCAARSKVPLHRSDAFRPDVPTSDLSPRSLIKHRPGCAPLPYTFSRVGSQLYHVSLWQCAYRPALARLQPQFWKSLNGA